MSKEMLCFTDHENEGEYVIRLQHAKGFISLGVIVAKEEADLVVRSLNAVCSDYQSNANILKAAWSRFVSG